MRTFQVKVGVDKGTSNSRNTPRITSLLNPLRYLKHWISHLPQFVDNTFEFPTFSGTHLDQLGDNTFIIAHFDHNFVWLHLQRASATWRAGLPNGRSRLTPRKVKQLFSSSASNNREVRVQRRPWSKRIFPKQKCFWSRTERLVTKPSSPNTHVCRMHPYLVPINNLAVIFSM